MCDPAGRWTVLVVVVLLALAVPFVILVLLLAMEWLEVKLLGSNRAHRSGDALLAWGSSAVDTSSTVRQACAARGSVATHVLDEEPWAASATRRRQAFVG